jgi:hypothetical protein
MTRIEIDGRVWTSAEDLPEHVKMEDVRERIEALPKRSDMRLGSSISIRIPKRFEPHKDIFEGLIGWDKYGPRFKSMSDFLQFTWTETLPLEVVAP